MTALMPTTKQLILDIIAIVQQDQSALEVTVRPVYARSNPLTGTILCRDGAPNAAPPLAASIRAVDFTFVRLAEALPAPLNLFRFSTSGQPAAGATLAPEYVISADDAGVVSGGDPDDELIYNTLIAGLASAILTPSGAGEAVTRFRGRGSLDMPGSLEVLTATPTSIDDATLLAVVPITPWHLLDKDELPWEGAPDGDDPTFHETLTYTGDGIAGPRIIAPVNPDGRNIEKLEILNPTGGSYAWTDALRSLAGFSSLLDGTPAFTPGVAANCTIQPGLQTFVVSGIVGGVGDFNVAGQIYYVTVHYGAIPEPV